MIDLISILIILGIVLIGIGASVFFIKKELSRLKEKKDDVALRLIKQDLEGIKTKFEEGYQTMAQELGKVQEIGHNMKEFQDFLKSPKLRGNLGEQVLKDLLEQILPQDNFKIQHKFKEGQVVDAIIKTNQGIIPIDSKFPMENFRKMKEDKKHKKKFVRDIKKHIDDISKKYILPQEGTVDFALMYTPSEAVYYEITINNPSLLEYGYDNKVYFVSPNSFYYFLKIIMIGLEGAKIEEASKRILEGLKAVSQESSKFGNELDTLTTHIDHARSASDRVRNKYQRLAARIETLTSLKKTKEKEKLKE